MARKKNAASSNSTCSASGATIAIIVFFIVVRLALVAVPLVLDYIWIDELPKTLLDLPRWPILFCIAAFGGYNKTYGSLGAVRI